MNTIRCIASVIFTIVFSIQTQGQVCTDFHNSEQCILPGILTGFEQSTFSKSALVEISRTYKYSLVLPSGRDYKIGVCTDPAYNPIKFKIIDAENSTVIYDNSDDGYNESIGFSVADNPRRFIIEVTVIAEKVKPKDVEDIRTCAGIHILYRNMEKIGFE